MLPRQTLTTHAWPTRHNQRAQTDAPADRAAGPGMLSWRLVRKIDVFNHIYPPGFRARLMQVAPGNTDVDRRIRAVPMVADLDVRFRVMDAFADYQQVLSLPTPPLENMADAGGAADLARAANDGMAELVARHPHRFPALVPPLSYAGADVAGKEAARAIADLGACVVQMFTNVRGMPIAGARYLPVFEL